jgi:hypothetical protein
VKPSGKNRKLGLEALICSGFFFLKKNTLRFQFAVNVGCFLEEIDNRKYCETQTCISDVNKTVYKGAYL